MAELNILIRAKDEASKTLADIGKNVEGMAKTYKIAGAAMLAASTAIAVGLAMCVKEAAQEQAGIERLRVSMRNVGLSYDEASKSLEKWIDKQAQTTAFADDEQRQSLSSLIALTGDLAESQNLLTIAMDLARWKSIDLVTSSDLIAKVYAGNIGILARYGVIVKQGATVTEALTEVQRLAAGQAKAYGQTLSGQFERFRNNVNDLKEAIGAVLMPVVTRIVEIMNSFITTLKNASPGLLQLGVAGAVATTVLLGLVGAGALIISYLPSIIKLFTVLRGVLIGLAITPVGLVFTGLAIALSIAVPWILKATSGTEDLTQAMSDLAPTIDNVRTALAEPGWAQAQKWGYITAEQFKILAKELDMTPEKLYKVMDAAGMIERTMGGAKNAVYLSSAAWKDATREMGNAARATSFWSGKERDLDAALKEADRLLNKELDTARRLHDERISALDDEYDRMQRNLARETRAQTDALQKQIDAIDKETQDEENILRDADYRKRLSELQSQIASTDDAEEKARLIAEYNELTTEHTRWQLLMRREAEKEALRQKIEEIQNAAETESERLQAELDGKKAHEDAMLKTVTDRVEAEKLALEGASAIALQLIDAELKTWQAKEASELQATLGRLATTQTAWQDYFKWFAEQNAIAAEGTTSPPATGGKKIPPSWWPKGIPYFQEGGVMPFTGPAFLHKGETVLPAGAEITIHNYLSIDGKQIAELITKHVGAKLKLQRAY